MLRLRLSQMLRQPISSMRSKYMLPVSSFSSSSDNPASTQVIYEGAHTSKIRLLRRISLSTTLICAGGMPLALTYSASSLDPRAQVVIAGTAMFASLSSTIFLQLFTHPYVTRLDIRPSQVDGVSVYRATRLNLLGNATVTEFRLSEASRVEASAHPFASFAAAGRFFYVFGGDLKDEKTRLALASK